MELEIKKRVCDFCESVLVENEIKENYLSIKGSICSNRFLKKTDKYNHLYVSNREIKNCVYDFCCIECFSKWITEQELRAMTALYKSFVRANEENDEIILEHYGLCEEDVKILKKEKLI